MHKRQWNIVNSRPAPDFPYKKTKPPAAGRAGGWTCLRQTARRARERFWGFRGTSFSPAPWGARGGGPAESFLGGPGGLLFSSAAWVARTAARGGGPVKSFRGPGGLFQKSPWGSSLSAFRHLMSSSSSSVRPRRSSIPSSFSTVFQGQSVPKSTWSAPFLRMRRRYSSGSR